MSVRHMLSLAHEQFPPGELLRQAVAGEDAGFDGVCCSDHFQSWWGEDDDTPFPPQSGHAWAWLGAAGASTRRVRIGSAVTAPVHRHHPAVVAQAFATLEEMFPGRVFLGVGSGESLNETPCGMDWPSPAGQLRLLDEALGIIVPLLEGRTVSSDVAGLRTRDARLWTLPARRPPVYVSAFHPGAARVAARWGDGVWTMGDPGMAEPVIEAYRAACDDLGREPGEIILQAGFSWDPDPDRALEAAVPWKATLPPEYFTDDWHDPSRMQRNARRTVSDDRLREGLIVGADTDGHVERIRAIERLGATTVVLMNVSPDGCAAVRAYGEHVLPALRGVRV